MTVGRVFRKVGDAWQAVGDQLPQWDHAPPRPNDPVAVWVLPAATYVARDVIAFAETAHQLLAPVPRADPAWHEVLQAAAMLHEADEVHRWSTQIELWLCRRLPGDWRRA